MIMRYANQKKAVIDKPDVRGIQHMGLDFDTLSMALKKLRTTSGYNLYFYLAKNAPDYEFFYSPAHIEEFTGMSKSSISKAKKELIDLGFIEETDSKIIFHARSIFDSLPQKTIVSDEKQTEKTERFPQETIVSDEKQKFLTGNNSFSQETKNFPQETKNFPQETIVSHSTEEIDNNNNNNNKIDSLEPTIILSERLEKLVQQFTFVGARDSIQQLLNKEKKEEEWIVAAINNKGISYFNKYGTLGLLFTNSYQKEIDGLLFKKKHDAAATEEWRKAMFEQGSQNLIKQPTVISVTKNKALSKPRNNRQRPPYDLDEIAKMA